MTMWHLTFKLYPFDVMELEHSSIYGAYGNLRVIATQAILFSEIQF